MKSSLMKVKLDLDEEERTLKEFTENFKNILNSREEEWNDYLNEGIKAFNNLELSESARYFRKLAASIKLTEQNISTKGNMSDRNTLNNLTGKHWIQHTKSWLVVDGRPGSLSKEIRNHPASYPPTLAEHFISYFTKRGDWVMDPFMGIGSTMVACMNLERKCLGIELNQEYADFTRSRCSIGDDNLSYRLKLGDARKAIQYWKEESIDPVKFVITSPPYWNMLSKSRGGVVSSHKKRIKEGMDEVYSKNEADLGNIDEIEKYISELASIFSSLKPILSPKAYIMIIIQNCRPKSGIMQPIAWDLANKLKNHFILRQEYIWCQDQKFAGIWGYPTTYVSNVHHHYCLVLQNSKE